MSLTNFLYGALILPESLPKDRRAPFLWKRANPVGGLLLLKRHHSLIGFAAINFLDQLAHVVFPSTFVLYASYRYGWDSKTIGLTLTIVGICAMIVQGGLVGRFVKWAGERTTLMLGLVFGVAGFACYGLANTGWLFWCAIPVGSLWGLATPPLQGMMSQLVDGTEQGKLQGANTSLTGIAQLIGPAIFTLSFSHVLGDNSMLLGTPFLIASFLVSAACLIGIWAVRMFKVAPVAAE